MQTFDYAVIFASVAGLVMVMGGIALIFKGSLVLASTDSASALSIEWKKNFRLSTQAPGIAFFIIGLSFSSVAIYASKPTNVEPLMIVGEVSKLSEPFTITARSSTWTVDGDSSGKINGRIRPHVENIMIIISAPGYISEQKSFDLTNIKNRTVAFGMINLEQEHSTIASNENNIVELEDKLAPVSAPSSYGASQ